MLRGKIDALDGVVLVALYVLYFRRVTAIGGDEQEPLGVAADLAALPTVARKRWVRGLMGYAACVILLTAVPFGDAVLGAGAMIGIKPYLLLQWIVPIATEMPELVIAFVLLAHGRGGQSLAVLLAGAVSQYTLALGTMPFAYHAGAGHGPLMLMGRERIELLLSSGVALYAIASLALLRLSRADSATMLALFAAQFLLPSVFTRLAFAVVFWVVAIDVLVAERRSVPLLLGALRPARNRAAERGGEAAPVADPPVHEHGDELQPRHAGAARRQEERLDVHERAADRHDPRYAEDRPADGGAAQVTRFLVEQREPPHDPRAGQHAAGRLGGSEREPVARERQRGERGAAARVDRPRE